MSDARLRSLVAALAATGAAIATYLLWTRWSGTELVCATGGCETVQTSRYAELAGAPVAVLGLAAYLVVLAAAVVDGVAARAIAAAVALVGMVFSAWLLYAQLVLIGAVCSWCVANDVVVSLLAASALARLLRAYPLVDSTT